MPSSDTYSLDTGDTLILPQKEACMASANGVLFLLAGDVHSAIEAEAAVQALEKTLTPVIPVLVLPAAAHGVPVYCARGNLHLLHFFPAFGAAEALPKVVL